VRRAKTKIAKPPGDPPSIGNRDRLDEYEEIVRYHLEQACRQRLTTMTARDLELTVRASRMRPSTLRSAITQLT